MNGHGKRTDWVPIAQTLCAVFGFVAVIVAAVVLANSCETQVMAPAGVVVFEDGSVRVDESEQAQQARADQWMEWK